MNKGAGGNRCQFVGINNSSNVGSVRLDTLIDDNDLHDRNLRDRNKVSLNVCVRHNWHCHWCSVLSTSYAVCHHRYTRFGNDMHILGG